MSIPQVAIDDILARIDIVDVIRPRVALKRAGREWQACCPFHNEKSPSFTVSPKKQFYYCFGCHASGNALRFLMEYEHLDFRAAMELLAGMAGVPLPEDKPVNAREAGLRKEERSVLEQAQDRYRSLLRSSPAQDYLRQRGVDAAMIERYGLGYAPAQGGLSGHLPGDAAERAGLMITRDDGSHYERFRNRLMFPIRDSRGQIVGFGGRTLVDDKAKYLNSPETPLFHKGRLLYGLYEARQARRDLPGFVVVEGYMDVIALAQFGIDYAVATLGTAATAQHLEQLLRIHPRVTFCFDGDKAGRRAAAHALDVALPLLRDGHQLHFLFLPEGHDPDSLVREIGAEAFATQVQQAQPLSDYLLRGLEDGLDMGTLEGRAAFSERARQKIQAVRAPAFRAGLQQALAHKASLPIETLDSGPPPAANGPSPRRAVNLGSPGPSRPSMLRRAFVLLLNWPELAQIADAVEELAALHDPGSELLSRVLDTLHAEPQLHCGALLGRFADEPLAGRLQQLASEEPEINLDDARVEFAGLIRGLTQQDPMVRMRELSARPFADLSTAERAELTELTRELSARKLPHA